MESGIITESGNCLNNGYKNGVECICQEEFHGKRCQFKLDIHSRNPIKRFGSGCLNDGYQPKDGLPCKCPEGFYGFMCEFMTNMPSDSLSACIKVPCRNGGVSI